MDKILLPVYIVMVLGSLLEESGKILSGDGRHQALEAFSSGRRILVKIPRVVTAAGIVSIEVLSATCPEGEVVVFEGGDADMIKMLKKKLGEEIQYWHRFE